MSRSPTPPQLSPLDPPDRDPKWRGDAAAVPDPTRAPALLQRALLAEVFAHARECYPEECCGLLLGPPAVAPVRSVRCSNVQSLRRSQGDSCLDASKGFWIDDGELEQTLRAADQCGESLRVVYHSHVDTGLYLSRTDLEAALGPERTPSWPDVGQLVVAVREGQVEGAALFEWDAEQGLFRGRQVREAQ